MRGAGQAWQQACAGQGQAPVAAGQLRRLPSWQAQASLGVCMQTAGPRLPACFWISVDWLSRSRSASGVLLQREHGLQGGER